MLLPRFVTIVTLLLTAGTTLSRVFKDPLGREIEAELILVEGEVVVLKMPDGSTLRSNREKFSKTDNTFFEAWVEANGGKAAGGEIFIHLEKADGGKVAIEIANRGESATPSTQLQIRAYTKPPGQIKFGAVDSCVEIPPIPAGKRAETMTEQLLPRRDWRTAGEAIGGVTVRLVGEGGEILADAEMETTDGGLEGAGWPVVPKAVITFPKPDQVVAKGGFEAVGETMGLPEGYRCVIASRVSVSPEGDAGVPRSFSFPANEPFREEARIWSEKTDFFLLVIALPEADAEMFDEWLKEARAGNRPPYPNSQNVARWIHLTSIPISIK